MSATTTTIPLLINNKSVTTSTIFEIKNPATERILHRCTGASPKEAHEAAITAKDAFPRWRDTRPYARRDILVKAADIMLSRKEELIRYQCEETGAGRVFAEKTFLLGVSFLRDFACRIPCIEGVVPAVTQEGEGAMILKQPYGVVLGIAPWYIPIQPCLLPLLLSTANSLLGTLLGMPHISWAFAQSSPPWQQETRWSSKDRNCHRNASGPSGMYFGRLVCQRGVSMSSIIGSRMQQR